MTDFSDDLLRRLEAVENRLDSLHEAIAALSEHKPEARPPRETVTVVTKQHRQKSRGHNDSRQGEDSPQPRESVTVVARQQTIRDQIAQISAESVFKWAGILLVILSVAFFFKYAIDQGWLVPVVRVGIGIAFGLVLLLAGLGVRVRRPAYAQVLQGGAIITFYISIVSASELYDLLDYPVAFSCMVVITALALVLGLSQRDPGLSILGLVGGLATPFLLFTPSGSVAGLVSYTCLLLAATSVVYFYWGWRSLLATSAIGGWIVLMLAFEALEPLSQADTADLVALQLGFVFAQLAFWFLPVIVELLSAGKSRFWQSEKRQPERAWTRWLEERALRHQIHLFVVVTPILGVILSGLLWEMDRVAWAFLCFPAAVLVGAIAVLLHRKDSANLAQTHGLAALLILATGLIAAVRTETTLALIAAEGMAVHLLAHRLPSRLFRWLAHSLWVAPGFWLLVWTLGNDSYGAPLIPLIATIVLAVAASFSFGEIEIRWAYRTLAYMSLLGWLNLAFGQLSSGQGLTTISWALCGIILIVVGLRLDFRIFRLLGFGTFGLVIIKLFLFDLSQLEVVWRILLFLGMGIAMLLLGYFMPNLWKPLKKESETQDAQL